jgi:hypothetical protein
MIVTRSLNEQEKDLLINNEHLELIIHGLDEREVYRTPAPKSGWSHEVLESIDYNMHSPFGWEAYLGSTENWIGSSEV